jgi:type I restriction enzyme S subunit
MVTITSAVQGFDLPDTWRRKRIKYVATYNDEALSDDTDEFKDIEYIEISGVSLVGGIESTSELQFHAAPSRARRVVRSGDTLVSTVRTYLKTIATVRKAPDNLIASTGFCVIRPGVEIDSAFLGWALKSEPIVGEIVARSVGVSYPATNASEVVKLEVPLPNLDTQRRIAEYLDHRTALVDALIEKKRVLLDRLTEKRQALITRAVTRGLNPAAPLKDSGIDWLGRVPAHWEVKPLKFVGDVLQGMTYSPDDVVDEGEGWLVVRASNIQDGRLVHADDVFVSYDATPPNICREGDIIICSRNGSRHLIGKCATVQGEWIGQTFGAFMTAVRSKFGSWLSLVLASQIFEHQSGMFMSSTINQLTNSTLKNLVVPLPPRAEQEEIFTWLAPRIERLYVAQDAVRSSIEKLTEYRAALVTAAVTGKIKALLTAPAPTAIMQEA